MARTRFVAPVVREAIRFGTRYFPKTVQAIQRYDVRFHRRYYGLAGGRGVRHGRDIGAAAGGLASQYAGKRGGIENAIPNPRDSSKYRLGKTRRRRTNQRSNRYCNCDSNRRYRR